MSWWRKGAEPVADLPGARDLARAAEQQAVTRRRAQAEQALRSHLVTPSGQCVVDALVAPWLTRQRSWVLDTGPLPPADVLVAALRLLQDEPSPAVVEAFVAAEPTGPRPTMWPPPDDEERLRFDRGRAAHGAGWRPPADVASAAHQVAAERLRELDDVAIRATGTRLPVDAVLGNPRWWPGRQAQPKALSNLFSHLFRGEEAQGFDETFVRASRDAQDLLWTAAGLPAVSPEAWVLAATDHAVAAAAREQP